jgi:hypothetical protein
MRFKTMEYAKVLFYLSHDSSTVLSRSPCGGRDCVFHGSNEGWMSLSACPTVDDRRVVRTGACRKVLCPIEGAYKKQ